MQACQFITFGKLPASASFSSRNRFHDMTSRVEVSQQLQQPQRRQSGTETGPLLSRVAENQPNDTSGADNWSDVDDVFGSSCVRSVSVPPRLGYRPICHSKSSNAAISGLYNTNTEHVSPPRMKRRKKKTSFAAVEQPETVTMAVRPDAIIINTDVAKTSNSVKQQLITKRLPLLPVSASAEAELLTFGGGAGEKCRSFSSSSSSDRFFAFDPNTVSSVGSSIGCSAGKVDGGSESAASGTGALGRKKKYSIRWQSDGPQSSPDLNSDDADSKESGYITLEDLQAQLGGRSSWSSDDRGSGQTDQDVGEISSGDEKRSEVLDASVGAAAVASLTSKSRGTSKIAEADADETAVDKTVAVLKTATTDTGIAGGSFGARRALSRIVPPPLESLDCCGSGMASPFFECRSAPPTCDSSLLRFTFTVRLDSKMFHRRMTQRSPTPIADDFRAITDGRDGLQKAIARQPMALPGRIDLLVEDASVSFVRKAEGSSMGVTLVPSNNDVTKQPTASLTEIQTSSERTDAKDEVDCCVKAEKTVSTVSAELCKSDGRQVECINGDLAAVNCATPTHTEQFVGEKVVIRAEVHRSADQLDSELPPSSRARTIGPPKSPLKGRTSQDAPGGGQIAADDTQQRRLRGRNIDSDDCVIRSLDSASATPTTPGSQQLLMDRDAKGNGGGGAMWNSFHGCVRHVDVDRIMVNEKGVASTCTKRSTEHRSMTTAEVRNGTTVGKEPHQQGSKEHAQKSTDADRCGMTMKKVVKKNFSNEDDGSNGCVSGTRQLTSQCSRNASEVSHNGVMCSTGLTEGKTLARGNKAGAPRRVFHRRHGGQRRSGSGESSSLSSEGGGVSESDDNELCSPCLMHSSANGAVIAKLSNSCCHKHHHFVPRDGTVDKMSSGKSRADSSQSNGQNRKQVRRTLRQFFRVENLFACRQHNATTAGKSIQNGHGPDIIDGRRLIGTETSTNALTTSTGSGNSCLTPTDVVPSNGNGCRWFHASRSVQRSAAGRSPSTSAVDRRSRQRSSRRSAASSATISQHHHHHNGTSRSVSPSTRRSATTMMRQRSRQPADAVAGEDGDDERTLRFHCNKTSADGCHCRSERIVAVCDDGSTLPVDRRHKMVRHHHHAAGGSGWDTVDGCPMTAPPTIAVDCFGNSGGTSERLWTTMSTSDTAALCQPHQRRRQQAATPAVTPISPLTPADDTILSSPAERFTACTLSATNQAAGVQSPGIDFIKSLSQLQHCVWYWGALGFDEAEAKLADKPDGTFLVRDSSDERYILSLSFRSLGATHHTRIEHYKGMFSFYAQPQSHSGATIVEFIDTAVTESRAGRCLYYLRPRGPGRSPAPVRLLYPLSRLRCMHSLKHLCKFTILRYVRLDLVDRLPVSPRLKEYLKHSGCPDGTAGNGHGTIKPNGDRADGTCSKSRRTEGFHT